MTNDVQGTPSTDAGREMDLHALGAEGLVRSLLETQREFALEGDEYGEAIHEPDGWEHTVELEDGRIYVVFIEQMYRPGTAPTGMP